MRELVGCPITLTTRHESIVKEWLSEKATTVWNSHPVSNSSFAAKNNARARKLEQINILNAHCLGLLENQLIQFLFVGHDGTWTQCFWLSAAALPCPILKRIKRRPFVSAHSIAAAVNRCHRFGANSPTHELTSFGFFPPLLLPSRHEHSSIQRAGFLHWVVSQSQSARPAHAVEACRGAAMKQGSIKFCISKSRFGLRWQLRSSLTASSASREAPYQTLKYSWTRQLPGLLGNPTHLAVLWQVRPDPSHHQTCCNLSVSFQEPWPNWLLQPLASETASPQFVLVL